MRKLSEREKLFLIIIFGLIINVVMILSLPIRGDEPFTMMTTAHGPVFAIEKAINFELQPPFYFLVMSIWRIVNQSLLWARLFSLFLYPAIIIFSYKLAKSYAPDIEAVLFCFLIAFNPFTLSMSSYARGYELILFQLIVLIYLFNKAYLSEEQDKISRIYYIIFAIIGLYTQYFIGFLLFALGIALLVNRGKNLFKIYLVDMLLPLFSLIILVPRLSYQINNSIDKINTAIPFGENINFFYQRIKFYLFPIWGLHLDKEYRVILGIIIIVLFVYSIYFLWKNKVKISSVMNFFLIIVAIPLLFFSYLLNKIGEANLESKHTIILFIPVTFLVFYIISKVKTTPIKFAWIIVISVLYFGNFVQDFAEFKDQPIQKAAEYVIMKEAKYEPILLYSYRLHYMFPYFYNGPNKLVDLPHPMDLNKPYNVSLWAFNNKEEINNSLEAYLKTKVLWVVTDEQNSDFIFGVNYHFSLLNDYINKNFRILDEYDYKGIKVQKLSGIDN